MVPSSTADLSQGIVYSPEDGGTVIAMNKSKLTTFTQIHSADSPATYRTRTVDLPRGICPPKFAGSFASNIPYFLNDSSTRSTAVQCLFINATGSAADIATDWMTRIVYLAYPCGKILAYDPDSLLHVTVYEDAVNSIKFIATHQPEGYERHFACHKS